MNPIWVIAAPIVLVIVGMVLNNLVISFDQPASSSEQDPAKRAAAESRSFHDFFRLQRARSLNRQKRVGQYAWLVLVVFVGSFWWMYADTVNKTKASQRIASIQTVATTEGKEVVLSVTLNDGDNVKYLIKAAKNGKAEDALKNGFSKDPVSSWELSRLETALNMGNSALPLGVALRMTGAAPAN